MRTEIDLNKCEHFLKANLQCESYTTFSYLLIAFNMDWISNIAHNFYVCIWYVHFASKQLSISYRWLCMWKN